MGTYSGTFQPVSDAPPRRAQRETVMAEFDRPLFVTVVTLMVFGLVSVYTASAHMAQAETGNSLSLVLKQAASMGLGFVLMLAMSRINFQVWRKTAHFWGLLALGLLVATLFIGTTVNGSERWIQLPMGVQLQSSDFAKLAMVFLVAQATSDRLMRPLTFINLGLIGAMVVLILAQPNLSVAMILSMVTAGMLFVGGLSIPLIAVAGSYGLYKVASLIQNTPYQKRRIEGWLDPWKDPLDSGYNLIQSYFAIGSGGLLGVGLGNSIQKLYYLPFQHTDFIFAVICEELGFFGGVIVVGLFVVLAWRGFAIALSCPNRFGQMLAFGMTLAIVLQALINICVTVGLMPVTGVTLPLISYGGTSVVTTLLMLGILLNVSRYRLSLRFDSEDDPA